MYPIEISNLTKVFRASRKTPKVVALDDVTINVEQGSIYGLLGPNGAGKTTLVKILLSITNPTLGGAKVLGRDIFDYPVRRKIGYLPENHKFPHFLSGGEVLKYYSRLGGLEIPDLELDKKIDGLLELVKMRKWKKTKIKNYSKGMMQRLGLAQALITDPELIFLDEPTDGVDPIGRKEIRDILLDMKSNNRTIFLNSHLLSEVELISDKVAILNRGKLLREGTVDALTSKGEIYKIDLEVELSDNFLKNNLSGYSVNKISNTEIEVVLENTASLNAVIDDLRNKKINIKSIIPVKSSLEETFISLINESESNNQL
jgi:ABC-2 type transport system ATP-binding protein